MITVLWAAVGCACAYDALSSERARIESLDGLLLDVADTVLPVSDRWSVDFSSARVDGVASSSGVDIVVARCHESLEWLDLWRLATRDHGGFFVANVYVYNKCCGLPTGVAGDQEVLSQRDVLERFAKSAKTRVQVACSKNIGTEAYPFIMHSAQNWGALAPFTAFLQGHGARLHQCGLERGLRFAASYGFAGLGQFEFKDNRPSSPLKIPNFSGRAIRPELIKQARGAPPCFDSNFASDHLLPTQDCTGVKRGIFGGQFIVSRENVRLRPRHLLQAIHECFESSYNNPREFPDTYTALVAKHAGSITQYLPGYVEGLQMERSWHVLFGMNNSLPEPQLGSLSPLISSTAGSCGSRGLGL